MRAYADLSFPDSWAVEPIARHFSVVLGKMLDGARPPREGDVELPYLRAANIQDDGITLESVNRMRFTADERIKLDLRAGDLLVVEGGAIGTSVLVDRVWDGWSFQKTLNRVRPTSRSLTTPYLRYVLRDLRDSGVLDVLCNKSTIPHLTAEKLLALRVPRPLLEEQEAIANYLDGETARIDELIAEQESLKRLLSGRRRDVVERAISGAEVVAPGARFKHIVERVR